MAGDGVSDGQVDDLLHRKLGLTDYVRQPTSGDTVLFHAEGY